MPRFEVGHTVSDLNGEVNAFDDNWTRSVSPAGIVLYTATADNASIAVAQIEEDGDYRREAKLYFPLGSEVYVIGAAIHYPPHAVRPL